MFQIKHYTKHLHYLKCTFVYICITSSLAPLHVSETFIQFEHTAEEFDVTEDTQYHAELCSASSITEAPADPSDPPANPSQNNEYTMVNFLQNSYFPEPQTASSVAVLEINQ